MELTKEFCEKRLKEQMIYMDSIISKNGYTDLTSLNKLSEREKLKYDSAKGQAEYFWNKLKQIRDNEKIQNAIQNYTLPTQEQLNNPLKEVFMTKKTLKVEEFHKLFDQHIGKIDELEPLKVRQLRIKLLFEEVMELAEAGDVMGTFLDLCHKIIEDGPMEALAGATLDGDNVNKKEELDALVDIEYVLQGKILTSGLHEVFDKGFDLIHENNMQKAHRDIGHIMETENKLGIPLSSKVKGNSILAYNQDGKLTKPHDHKKVDLSILHPSFQKDLEI